MFEHDKELKAEERAYSLWVQQQKNRILNIKNETRKQELWNKLFPPMESDDGYLTGNIF